MLALSVPEIGVPNRYLAAPRSDIARGMPCVLGSTPRIRPRIRDIQGSILNIDFSMRHIDFSMGPLDRAPDDALLGRLVGRYFA